MALVMCTILEKRVRGVWCGEMDLPCDSFGFHFVGDVDVFGPDVVLPFDGADDSRADFAAVDADAHVYVDVFAASEIYFF